MDATDLKRDSKSSLAHDYSMDHGWSGQGGGNEVSSSSRVVCPLQTNSTQLASHTLASTHTHTQGNTHTRTLRRAANGKERQLWLVLRIEAAPGQLMETDTDTDRQRTINKC